MAQRKILVLGTAYFHVLFTAGVVFGWAALEGCYLDLPQDGRDRIFTVAASANYLSNLFFGPFLDRYGATKCSGLACFIMLLGALGMVAAECRELVGSFREIMVLLSFGTLGFAGPGVQMPTLRCELLFPESASMVTSVNASLFDASCVVFLLFQVLLMWCPSLDAKQLFIIYAAVMLLCLFSGQVLFRDLDRAHAKACEAQSYNVPNTPLMRNAGGATPRSPFGSGIFRDGSNLGSPGVNLDKAGSMKSGLLEHSKVVPFREAVRSFKFSYLVCFCAINILRLNFVVMTLNTQLATFFKGDSATASMLTLTFSTLLPLGGLAAPLTALLLEKYRRWSYRVCLILSLIYGVCIAFPHVWMQIAAYVIISVSRQLTYSIVFALTSALFGQEHLGKLLAANNSVVFTVGLLQYPIAQLVGSSLLPSWFVVDMAMAALALPLLLSNGGL